MGIVEIWTAEDLYNVRNNPEASYIQMADIDLSVYTNWEPIGGDGDEDPFMGNYDGNHFKITGLNINRPQESVIGLFGNVVPSDPQSEFKNINLVDVNITGEQYIGALAGTVVPSALFIFFNCHSSGVIYGVNDIGGLFGMVQGDGSYSSSSCDIHAQGVPSYGTLSIGGFAANLFTEYTHNCHSTGSIDITGSESESVERCGGFAYYLHKLHYDKSSKIENCYATGSIICGNKETSYLGGFAVSADSDFEINSCYATGDIISEHPDSTGIGGFLYENGFNNEIITNCYATGDIKGFREISGFIVHAQGEISNCYASGNVEGNELVAGFIRLFSNGSISKCYSSGNVIGESWVGGFVEGIASANINNCYTRGNLYGNQSTGGFISRYMMGEVILNNCYSARIVSGGNGIVIPETDWVDVGGFIGPYTAGTDDSCYYDYEIIGQIDTNGGNPKTTIEMKTQSTFIDWDFDNVWKFDSALNGGYPCFIWQTTDKQLKKILGWFVITETGLKQATSVHLITATGLELATDSAVIV